MINFLSLEHIILFASSCIAFIYGCIKFLKPKTALYKQIVVFSVGCFMLGNLYNLLVSTLDKMPTGFNIGYLSMFGGFLFIFSAEFGQMDGLVDGKEKKFIIYRILSLISPALIAGIAFFGYRLTGTKALNIYTVPLFVIMMLASYFNLKHLIMPDVEFGILKSIRIYNLFALILSILTAVNIIYKGTSSVGLVTSILMGIDFFAIVVGIERGSKKWTL